MIGVALFPFREHSFSPATRSAKKSMNTKKIHRNLVVTTILLLLSTALFELTDIDLVVQDRFFDFNTATWLIDADNQILRGIFYSGSKKIIIALGVAAILCLGFSLKTKRFQSRRKGLLIFVLALIVVPFLVARAKQITNMYCPDQIRRYDGVYPYVKLFEQYPQGFHPKRCGKCFPAGHASGGFALMALYFTFKKRRSKLAGISIGMAMGWIMGLYQMLKGAHYLSHTVTTMLLAWIIICLIQQFVTQLENKKSFAWIREPLQKSVYEDAPMHTTHTLSMGPQKGHGQDRASP
jgi:membrane-associated PAP2 superfamily phosphatase